MNEIQSGDNTQTQDQAITPISFKATNRTVSNGIKPILIFTQYSTSQLTQPIPCNSSSLSNDEPQLGHSTPKFVACIT